MAVITGRPALTAVEYGFLDQVPGIVVLGQYGRQRWQDGQLESPPPPEGLAVARERLPAVLGAAAVADGTWVEDLGDRPAFAAIRRMREDELPGIAVCSGSSEVVDLAGEADLVIDGPAGVARLLAGIAAAIS